MVSNPWTIIIGMFIVGIIPRVFPLLAFRNRPIPEKLSNWMSFVPVSIFAALVFSDIFFWEGAFQAHPLMNVKLIPSLIVLLISLKMKNLFISMITGVVAIMLMLWLVS